MTIHLAMAVERLKTSGHGGRAPQDICIKYFLILFCQRYGFAVFVYVFVKGTLFSLNNAQCVKIVT